MTLVVLVTPGGYIPNWYACDCGSTTYANLSKDSKTIVCGGCDREQATSHFVLRFIVNEKDRIFEESING